MYLYYFEKLSTFNYIKSVYFIFKNIMYLIIFLFFVKINNLTAF